MGTRKRQTVQQTKAKLRRSIATPIDSFVPGSIQKKQEIEKRKFLNDNANKNPKSKKKAAPKKAPKSKKPSKGNLPSGIESVKDALKRRGRL